MDSTTEFMYFSSPKSLLDILHYSAFFFLDDIALICFITLVAATAMAVTLC